MVEAETAEGAVDGPGGTAELGCPAEQLLLGGDEEVLVTAWDPAAATTGTVEVVVVVAVGVVLLADAGAEPAADAFAPAVAPPNEGVARGKGLVLRAVAMACARPAHTQAPLNDLVGEGLGAGWRDEAPEVEVVGTGATATWAEEDGVVPPGEDGPAVVGAEEMAFCWAGGAFSWRELPDGRTVEEGWPLVEGPILDARVLLWMQDGGWTSHHAWLGPCVWHGSSSFLPHWRQMSANGSGVCGR